MTNKLLHNVIKNENIQFVCDVMSKAFMLPIHFLDKHGKVLFEASEMYINNPLISNKVNIFNDLIGENQIYNFPVFKINGFYETFFYISIKIDERFIGTFIVGPSLSFNLSLENVEKLISDFNIPIKYKKVFFEYYNKLPIISANTLVNFSLVLYYSIYNTKLDVNYIKEKNCNLGYDNSLMHNSLSLNLSETRRNSTFHMPYKYEKLLFEYIKEGDSDKLLNFFYSPPSGELGTLSKRSALRHFKNQFIYACTLAYRAAIDGGVDYELAYELSDQYIQTMEEMKNIQDIRDLRLRMPLDFTNKVYISKNKQKYSNYITKCQKFILNHIYEDIRLSKLGKIVNLNPNYLSEMFTKEVGITISKYIQKERIEEAKKLLVLTDYSLSEISTLLNFGTQSYFSTIFKRLTGVTPKEYRNLNKIN